MTKPSVLLTLLAALALAGGWFLLQSSGDVAPPLSPVAGGRSAADEAGFATEGTATVAPASVTVSTLPEDEEEFADEALDRSELELAEDLSPELVIQVWDRKRGQAADAADVYVLFDYDGPDFRDPFQPHLCELAIAEGRRFRATSDGRVELPRLTERALVAAQLPGAVGFRILDEGHRQEESVTLRTDETLTVRVLDEQGRPAVDVPVGIQQRVVERVDLRSKERELEENKQRVAEMRAEMERDPMRADSIKWRVEWSESRVASLTRSFERLRRNAKKQREQRQKNAKKSAKRPKDADRFVFEVGDEVRARRRTDNRGYAVFRHFQFSRERAEKWWPGEHRDRFEAVLSMPLAQPVRAPFLGRPLPEEAIELRLPATGSITLRTVDCDGRPFTHPVRGTLRIKGANNPEFARVQLRKEQDEDGVVFSHVGIGMQMFADCRLDDRDFRWRSPVFAGPQLPGEDVVVDLVVAPKAAMLHGRVLDESGAAMVSRELTLLINSSLGRLEGEEVVLDREGRFHLPYSPRDANFAPFRFQIRDEQDGDLPGLSQTLPMLAKEGVTDLGDLQLGLLDQVAFGRVVNDLGEPIDDAHIQLQRERMRADSIWPQFKDEAFTDAHTDENGEFRLYGDMESARYRLRVRADEHFPEETRGIDRVTGSEIKLMRKARLVGSVKLPEWLASKRVKVELRSLDEPGRDRDDEIRDWRGKQYIYFDWARPGRYTLELRVREFTEPFLRVDDLLVRPGDHELHPRLTDLDLSSYLHRFEVFAVDEAGKRINPRSPLLARVMGSDGESQYVGFSWKGGRIEIVNSAPTLAVSPFARGFRSEATVLSAGRNELRFLRVPKITLSLPGIRGIIGATKVWVGMRLLEAPELERLDGRGGWNTLGFERTTTSYGRLGPNERTRVAPLMDGRYRVTAYLGDKAKGGLVELALGEVDVRVVPGGQPVLLEVVGDGPAVRSAMQDVLRRQAEAAAAPGASAGR